MRTSERSTFCWVIACASVIAELAMFAGWQHQFVPLRAVARQCRALNEAAATLPTGNASRTPEEAAALANAAKACPTVWFDISAVLAPGGANPAGALAARNWVHTLWLAAVLWFAAVCVPLQPWRMATRWCMLVTIMLVQPTWLTRTLDTARPEPPFGDSGDGAFPLRILFPAAYGDLDDLVLPLDPPTLMATFLGVTIASVHPGLFAALIGGVQITLAVIYAVVLRRVTTPSLALTLLVTWALTHDFTAYPNAERIEPVDPASCVVVTARRCELDDGEDDDPPAYPLFEVGGTMSDDEAADTVEEFTRNPMN